MRPHLRLMALCAAMTLMVPASFLLANPADPFDGTWELNVKASKFSPGPGPKSQTRVYVSDGKTVKMTSKGVDGEGKPTNVEYTASYDGKDHAMTGNPNADTISLKRVDEYTADSTLKKAGKVIMTGTRVISKDGKVMTITSTGKNLKGEDVNNTMVFDKK